MCISDWLVRGGPRFAMMFTDHVFQDRSSGVLAISRMAMQAVVRNDITCTGFTR
jgi:hypothetical protein